MVLNFGNKIMKKRLSPKKTAKKGLKSGKRYNSVEELLVDQKVSKKLLKEFDKLSV